mmetsp:Transcript_18931/g.40996  ORF Transcript_18931/g.40996 Transcript_18931/m.40996 type:complete len:90 (-) Transcript_18931:107-376(-)
MSVFVIEDVCDVPYLCHPELAFDDLWSRSLVRSRSFTHHPSFPSRQLEKHFSFSRALLLSCLEDSFFPVRAAVQIFVSWVVHNIQCILP